MIKRRLPMKRTELKRTTTFRSASQLKRTKNWMPVKARKSEDEIRGRDLVAERAGVWCEIRITGVCRGRATVFSHRKRRGQSKKAEKWAAYNGLAGCGGGLTGCEGHLTAHGSDPTVRFYGWTVHPEQDPALVPVYRRGVWVWLRADGESPPLTDAEVAAWTADNQGEVA